MPIPARSNSLAPQADAGVRPLGLRLGLARRGGSRLARDRRQRLASDRDGGGAACRSGARPVGVHLDAGECVAGARGPCDGQGGDVGLARRQRRSGQDRALSRLQGRRRGRSAVPYRQYRRRSAAGGCFRHRCADYAGALGLERLLHRAQLTSRSTASRPTSPRPSRTTALSWC